MDTKIPASGFPGDGDLIMDFSVLTTSEVSQKRNGTVGNKKPPAMRGETICYTKNHLSITIELFRHYCRKGDLMANKNYDLAHTKWMCKYHIVFTPKYRRKIIYNQLKNDIRDILKQLCSYKGVEVIEGHLMPDHIHMLVSIPPKMSVSSFMGYLKGKSALMIFDRHANLKYKFGNRHFWSEGYYER